MSTQDSLPFVPDNAGRAIAFLKSTVDLAAGMYYQIVVAKPGGDLNVGSSVSITTAAIAKASSEVVTAENPKRTLVYIQNTHATKAIRLIGSVSDDGGLKVGAGEIIMIAGGGALRAFSDDGSATAFTLYLLENKVG